MLRFDAHAHLPLDEPDSAGVLARLGLRVLNVCVDSPEFGGLDAQRDWYTRLHTADPARFSWCTSFSLRAFDTPGWLESAISSIDRDVADGAAACKVWKNIGMELLDSDTGRFILIDDERFSPIFEHLAHHHIPLLAHIGEPLACWQPLDVESPHSTYYRQNPQWHWHGRADVPSHADLMASRDRVLARHPSLLVVGAHFGSHESDLHEVAIRFDRYANFHVDTSARLGDVAKLAREDREAVRRFFLDYRDRILWGVDWMLATPASRLDASERARIAAALAAQYELELRFYTTADDLLVNGQPVRGLALPDDVADQIMRRNAERVYRAHDPSARPTSSFSTQK